jgi:hypothetical protein
MFRRTLMKKTRIAILVALALGMPIGVVAVERAASELPPASEPAAVQIEAPAQAEAPAQPAETAVQAEPAPVAAAPEPVATPAPVERYVESTTFPEGSLGENDYWQSPIALAYFERQDQERRHLVARGDAFPAGHLGDNAYERLPTEIAYFERIEQERLARIEAEQPRVAAAPETAPVQPVASAESSAAGPSAPANEPAPPAEREQVVAAESRNVLQRAAEFVSRPFRGTPEDKPAAPAADTRVPMAVDSRVPMTAGESAGTAENPTER